jgi:hypothetical protein
MTIMETGLRIIAIGIGATAVMDVWLMLLKRLGVPPQSFAMLGRWIGHWRHGQWRHERIAAAAPVRGELAVGWGAHYAIGIAFAALAALVWGHAWLAHPALAPALLTGLATTAAPLLVMQPALGAGIASSRTPTPLRNILKSVATHAVFGLGLYLAASAVAEIPAIFAGA